MNYKKHLPISFLMFSLVFIPIGAHADEILNFIQVSCVPELDYFSLHTISLSNTQIGGMGTDQPNIFTPEALLKKPYTCNLIAAPRAHLPAYSLTAKVVDYIPGSNSAAGCPIPSFGISVELNGSEIYRVRAFNGICSPNTTHLVEVDAFLLRSCALPLHKNGQSSCYLMSLRELRQK